MLVEIANGPEVESSNDLSEVRARISDQDLIFRLRLMTAEMRARRARQTDLVEGNNESNHWKSDRVSGADSCSQWRLRRPDRTTVWSGKDGPTRTRGSTGQGSTVTREQAARDREQAERGS